MKERAEKELIGFLRHYYGDAWSYHWEAEDGGFELVLQVWNQEEETSE